MARSPLLVRALAACVAVSSAGVAGLAVPPGATAAAAPGDPVIARDDRVSVLEDTVLRLPAPGVLANDQGSGRLRAALAGRSPARATVRLGGGGALRVEPDQDAHGTLRIAYRAVDRTGRADLAVVRVAVVPVNDAPSFQAGADQTVAAEAGPQRVTGWASSIDPGARNERDQQLAFALDVDRPALFDPQGLPRVDADGTLRYTPAPDASGTATIAVALHDDGGVADGGQDTSVPATLHIDVTPSPTPPSVTAGQDATVLSFGTSAPLAPRAEVADTDSPIVRATLTAAAGSGLSLGAPQQRDGLAVTEDQSTGRLVLAGSAPAEAYQRALRSVQVATTPRSTAGVHAVEIEVEDAHGLVGRATRQVRILPLPEPPPDEPTVTGADTAAVDEDTDATGNVLTNDTDPDDSLTVVDHTDPAHGTLTIAADGDYRYVPDPDWNGTVPTITYTTNTGATGTLDITIRPVNDAPIAHDDIYTIAVGTELRLPLPLDELTVNDTDVDGDALHVFSYLNPVNGYFSSAGDDVVFTPTAGFSGMASFDYRISDGHGGVAIGTVRIRVDAPTMTVADSVAVDEDTDATGNVLANDTDPDDTLTVVDHTDPAHGTLTIAADGDYRYVPDPDWNGTVPTITYTTNTGATGTLDITIRPVNDAPIAHDDTYTIAEDTTLAIPLPLTELTVNDTDADGDALSVTMAAAPVNGSFDVIGGNVVFTPTAEFSGTASFVYGISDGHGGVSTATVVVTVTAVDDPTVTGADTAAVDEDTDATGNVLANDTDPDDTLTVVDHTNPAHGTFTMNADGDYRYVPEANWNGTVPTITYTTNTGATGTLDITIRPVNDAPIAHDDAYTIAEDTTLAIPLPLTELLANDTDVDGDALSVTMAAAPVNGSFDVIGGNVVFTPTNGFSGTATFVYGISDGHGGVSTATVVITVNPS